MAMAEKGLVVAEPTPVTEYVPAVSITIEQAKDNFERLHQVTRELMRKGVDYDTIPGTPKPTLLKPGAEHLLQFFGLGHKVQRVQAIEEWDKGFFYYCYRVSVFKARPMPDGTVYEQMIAECEGSANSKERRYRNQDVFTIVNTLQKMAIKRALVGATLQATGTSGMFTQDLEDMKEGEGDVEPAPESGRTQAPPSPRTDAQTKAKAVFAHIREWALGRGVDPKAAEDAARQILHESYKVDTCGKLTAAQWQQIWDNRARLVMRVEAALATPDEIPAVREQAEAEAAKAGSVMAEQAALI